MLPACLLTVNTPSKASGCDHFRPCDVKPVPGKEKGW